MDRFDPFVKYADVYGDIINWEKDPMNKPQNQNKYFFSDGKTYYEQICKMLRLMSVFKEAFNQIYSNEDEISEAWENFVNNLSASVVEGSEPDVTLTWTDDSVNFEFTMVPGVPGEQGVGITSISFNSDYTMTITLSDGNSYTSMSLKGETGPQGPQGETGSGLQILDVYASLADLQSAHPTGEPGDAYQVGSAGNYTLYIWSSSQSAWVQAGTLGTVSPYTSAPLMDGTASAGSQNLYARGDHVHPSDTSRASKEELDALIKTSQALIDQSFTYRESPAIQDGLARIDKIKGNTLVWNQIVQNGNFADTTGWSLSDSVSLSVANNVLTATIGTTHHSSIRLTNTNLTMVSGKMYLFMCDVKPSKNTNVRIQYNGIATDITTQTITANVWSRYSSFATMTADNILTFYYNVGNSLTEGDTVQFRNCVLFDLSIMGLDITDPSEFTSLFPLPYYAYNQGTLLSFNGNGIKTTGANLISSVEQGTINPWSVEGSAFPEPSNTRVRTTLFYLEKGNYTITSQNGFDTVIDIYRSNAYNTYDIDVSFPNWQTTPKTFTMPYDGYAIILFRRTDNTNIAPSDITGEWMYNNNTESVTDLPTLNYFPTGMKSAGDVYDELTENKAITRVGAYTITSFESKSGATANNLFSTNAIINLIKKPSADSVLANIKSNYGEAKTMSVLYNNDTVGVATNSNGTIYVGFGLNGSVTTLEQANAYVQSNPITVYYELATPTETDVDLDLSFKSYLDGTEQLLPVNASVPSTSPIIADMTYLSIDDAMEYIIEKLANVPQNTQQILESLEDDVADLQTDVGALQPAVSALQTSVGNINTNIGQMSSTVAGHTSSISDMQSDITDLNTGLNDLEDTVTDHTSRISTLESGLSTTNGQVQNLETSVSGLDSTVTDQGETVMALDSIIQDISNNPVIASLGQHELGFVAAYVSATLAANTGTKVTIPKPTIFPNNYTPLFIVGMTTGSYNVSICEIPYSFGNRDSVDCRVWNHGGQQTTQITVYILCMRQRQSQ